jgi:hypothetical protein
MGHLLKIKCIDSRANVHILSSKMSRLYHDSTSTKFSTNSVETDYSVDALLDGHIVEADNGLNPFIDTPFSVTNLNSTATQADKATLNTN